MDFVIKEEPSFYEESAPTSFECCLLCQEGQETFRELLKHFRLTHSEDYNQLPDDSIVQLCSCPDAIQLQFRLLNHILAKSLPPKAPPALLDCLKHEEEEEEEEEGALHAVKVELNEDSEVSSESLSTRKNQRRRRRRRRVELARANDLTVRCRFCPRTFTKAQSLQNHFELMHDPLNQFKCTKCEHGHCRSLRNLNAHMRTHEADSEPLAEAVGDSKVCPKCGKAWHTEVQLYHHMLTHREKLLECDHCGMRFNMKNSLQRHILRHLRSEERPKERERAKEKRTLCQYCSMWISFYNLKRHIRTSHSDNKHIFKCDFEGCTKSFTEAQNLKDHKNSHFGLKPYICEFCSKTFERIASLRRHKYRHTDPEKYKCKICGECFVNNKTLSNHVQRQHHDVNNDAKPFACDFEGCNSTFKYENYLQNHKRDVHIRKRTRVRSKEVQRTNFFDHQRASMKSSSSF